MGAVNIRLAKAEIPDPGRGVHGEQSRASTHTLALKVVDKGCMRSRGKALFNLDAGERLVGYTRECWKISRHIMDLSKISLETIRLAMARRSAEV